MTGFVIVRYQDGAFVAAPGLEHSYTRLLQNARLFPTRAEAERERCGNETVQPVAAVFGR